MPNSCSAPGCKSNYYETDDRVPVFKLPTNPPELKQAWIRALRRDDIEKMKVVRVCIKHFRNEDIEATHQVPNGDGTFTEVPRARPKLKEGAVPCLLPGCPAYYSSTTTSKRTRLSFDSKEEELMNKTIQMSLISETEETQKYKIKTLQDLKDKLILISLPNNWLVWHRDNLCTTFIHPSMTERNISVDMYLEINCFLSATAFLNGQNISISANSITDIRQIESILYEISNSTSTSKTNSHKYHISRANEHIKEAISEFSQNDGLDSCDLEKLEFIICQLDNATIPKNRRRYNVITQIMAIKTHLISPACYKYLQGLDCLSLPHVHTLDKLYSSFGLENDFCAYLRQATSSFSPQERNVIIQMDEIHVKSDISYKGGKIYGPNLNPEDPTRTVFAVMVSSLHKKWSCISRLLPCASISAGKIFPIIKSCIIDIENCGLRVQVISTDNYPLNVNLFKLFSPNNKLEVKVPHPYDENRILFLTFDFVHLLKSIRNNWLNQKDFEKTMHYPNLENFEVDYCRYPVQIYSACFQDVRLLYRSERHSLAKLAPHLTIKACFPSSIERQNVKMVLKVINELTLAALKIQNESRSPDYRKNTSDFVSLLLSLWKIFNVNTPFKGIRLNECLSNPLTLNDERFSYLNRIVYWLDAWEALPGKVGKLSKQTFTSFRHACIALPEITNHLIQSCGFSYVLSSFLQTDPLEHHFGLYRMMSGSNYHISYLQILETERRLKLSSVLKMFSQQSNSSQSIQTFVKSFSSYAINSDEDDDMILDPFLESIMDLSSIECTTQVIQSLAFIAGYTVHKYLKHHQPCHVCLDALTFEKEFIFDLDFSSEFKLLELTDRGGLKYPSESLLCVVIMLWKIMVVIENDNNLLTLFVEGSSRNILVELTLVFMEEIGDIDVWRTICVNCNTSRLGILRKLVFTAANCIIANKIKNYNSLVSSKAIEKRKLKKFS